MSKRDRCVVCNAYPIIERYRIGESNALWRVKCPNGCLTVPEDKNEYNAPESLAVEEWNKANKEKA